MIDRRSIPAWVYQIAGGGGAAAIILSPMLVFGRLHGHELFTPVQIVTTTLATTYAVAWGFVFAWLTFRRRDEFAQQGSKFAWYWGGMLGLLASGPIAMFISRGGLHWLMPTLPVGPELAHAFMLGYSLPVLLQAIGLLGGLYWWRVAKR